MLMLLITYINRFLDVIFPPRCIECKEFGTTPLCHECLAQIELVKQRTSIDNLKIQYLAEYAGALKTLICQLKFNKKLMISELLSEMLQESGIDKDYRSFDVVIPVPLSKQKLKSRGFNQSLLLIEKLFPDKLNCSAIIRSRETNPLFNLSDDERRQELRGAFQILNIDLVRGKRILIFDDIVTTGSTLNEISNILLVNGALEVQGLSLARTVKRRITG